MKIGYFICSILFVSVLIFLGIFLYAGTAELRYTVNSVDRQRLYEMVETRNINEINNFLETNNTIDGKLLAISYIKEFKSITSVPSLIKQLSYDHPWVDTDFADRFFGERYYKATDVRRSAYRNLRDFKNIQAELDEHFESSNDIGKFYIAALQHVLGYDALKDVARLAEKLKAKYSGDIWFVMRDIETQWTINGD